MGMIFPDYMNGFKIFDIQIKINLSRRIFVFKTMLMEN